MGKPNQGMGIRLTEDRPGHLYRVAYLKEGRERWSPWFRSYSRAHIAKESMREKHGQAIVIVD